MNQIETVTQIIRDVLDRPDLEITLSDGQETVEGWDSLASINILTAVSQEFDLTLGIDDFPSFTSVAKIVELLKKAAA